MKRRNNNMKLNTFVTLFENKKRNGGVEEFVKEHIKDKYVPIEEKQVRANTIVENTYYETNDDGEKSFHVNSVAHLLFTMLTLVDMYTDIEIEFKHGLEQYNKLKECGALDYLVAHMNKNEIDDFKMVLTGVQNDVMTNEYEPHAYFASQVERFGKLLGFVIEPFLDKLNAQDIVGIVEKLNLK